MPGKFRTNKSNNINKKRTSNNSSLDKEVNSSSWPSQLLLQVWGVPILGVMGDELQNPASKGSWGKTHCAILIFQVENYRRLKMTILPNRKENHCSVAKNVCHSHRNTCQFCIKCLKALDLMRLVTRKWMARTENETCKEFSSWTTIFLLSFNQFSSSKLQHGLQIFKANAPFDRLSAI